MMLIIYLSPLLPLMLPRAAMLPLMLPDYRCRYAFAIEALRDARHARACCRDAAAKAAARYADSALITPPQS